MKIRKGREHVDLLLRDGDIRRLAYEAGLKPDGRFDKLSSSLYCHNVRDVRNAIELGHLSDVEKYLTLKGMSNTGNADSVDPYTLDVLNGTQRSVMLEKGIEKFKSQYRVGELYVGNGKTLTILGNYGGRKSEWQDWPTLQDDPDIEKMREGSLMVREVKQLEERPRLTYSHGNSGRSFQCGILGISAVIGNAVILSRFSDELTDLGRAVFGSIAAAGGLLFGGSVLYNRLCCSPSSKKETRGVAKELHKIADARPVLEGFWDPRE